MSQHENSYKIDFSKRDPFEQTDPEFHTRWSPRSFKKTEIPKSTLTTIFDAARWSPSSFNEQPWLFITSGNDDEFKLFLSLLTKDNQVWASNTSVLGFVFGKRHFARNNRDNRFYFFDAGAAWMAMTLQARKFGLYTHGMGGIKRDEICPALNVPEETYEVICGFVIGVIDRPDNLPVEISEREIPTPRKPLEEIWRQGRY